MRPQIWEFVPIAETLEWRFLSITAAARLPTQQPKSRSAYAALSRYSVLGSIYYVTDIIVILILDTSIESQQLNCH